MAHGCRQRLKRLSAQQKAVEGSRVVGRGGNLGVFIYISHLEGACSYRADLCIDSGVKQMKRGSGWVQYHLCTCNRLGLTHVNGPASAEWVEPDGLTSIALWGWGCNVVWHSRGQKRGDSSSATLGAGLQSIANRVRSQQWPLDNTRRSKYRLFTAPARGRGSPNRLLEREANVLIPLSCMGKLVLCSCEMIIFGDGHIRSFFRERYGSATQLVTLSWTQSVLMDLWFPFGSDYTGWRRPNGACTTPKSRNTRNLIKILFCCHKGAEGRAVLNGPYQGVFLKEVHAEILIIHWLEN